MMMYYPTNKVCSFEGPIYYHDSLCLIRISSLAPSTESSDYSLYSHITTARLLGTECKWN